MKRIWVFAVLTGLLVGTAPALHTRANPLADRLVNFSGPTGVAVDREGRIYVVDADSARVDVLASNGRLLRTVGSFPLNTTPQQLPFSVATDARGRIYIGTSVSIVQNPSGPYRGRVQQFSAAGRLLHVYGGTGPAPLLTAGFSPAVDTQGTVYVSEAISNTDRSTWIIRKFAASGKPLASWHMRGRPAGVAVDARGDIYVTEQTVPDVVKLSPGGRVLRRFGGSASLTRPTAVAVAGNGDLYVVDGVASQVVKFNPDGRLLLRWGHAGVLPGQFNFCTVGTSGAGTFSRPMGIALDQAGKVYISEKCNVRVQKFSSTGKLLAVYT